jgi:hypothetical protein
MRYSILRLLCVTAIAAIACALWPLFELIADSSWFLAMGITFTAMLMLPIVVLTSPQRGTQLDVTANPFARLLKIFLIAGFGLIGVAVACKIGGTIFN